MRRRCLVSFLFSLCAVPLLSGFLFAASQEKVIHVFSSDAGDGISPNGGLIADAKGNLYGTTYEGGTNNFGTVFELVRGANEEWSENILYNFDDNGSDGFYPAASLTFDGKGNLYGTTWAGGVYTSCSGGCGTVFKLVPVGDGTWSESILHSFDNDGADGAGPLSTLTSDTWGNLYGTTSYGGTDGQGTVFEVTGASGGAASEIVLHSFNEDGEDGVAPLAGVVVDRAGNLYGTTVGGDSHDWGTVFQLTRASGHAWTEKVLHSFTGSDGASPYADLVLDKVGNIYGTTFQGGANANCSGSYGCGTVFVLTRDSEGVWKEKVVHSFDGSNGDGQNPYAGLVADDLGALYGTTYQGGSHDTCVGLNGCGTVFKLFCNNGKWEELLLHSFTSGGSDGFNPDYGHATLDSNGNLFGMTFWGVDSYITDCSEACGTIYEIQNASVWRFPPQR